MNNGCGSVQSVRGILLAAASAKVLHLVLPALLTPVLALCLLFSVAGSAVGAENVRLQLKWQHSFQFAGYYAAEMQGYYAKAGLKVEIVPATPGLQVLDEVTAGRADFGVGTSSLLLDYARGVEVQLLANVFQHSAQVLLSRQLSAVPDLNALRGQAIMLEPAADELWAYLRREGFTEQDFVVLPHSFSLQELLDGKVAAMSAYSSHEPLLLQQQGTPFHLFSPKSAGINFYGDNLFTRTSLVQKKRDVAERFRAASVQGWTYAMQHPAEVVDYMLQKYPAGFSRAFLMAEAQAMQPLLQAELIEPGYINPERWQHIAQVYQQMGLLGAMPDLDDFLYEPPAQLNLTWLLIALLVLMGLLLALLLLAYISKVNRRLHQLLYQQRQQQRWHHLRSLLLQQLLRDELAPTGLMTLVLQYLQQYRASYHPVLILDRPGQPPLLLGVDLADAGMQELQRRLDSFGDDSQTPGLNLLKVPQLGRPSPAFDNAEPGSLTFCAFPLQTDSAQIPGVLLVWQPAEFSASDFSVLDDAASLAAVGLERLRDREALKQSEARHRLLTEHASDVIWTMDLNGRMSFVSPSIKKLLGYTPEEALQLHVSELLCPDSARKVLDQMQRARALVAIGQLYPEFDAELEQPHKNGGTVWAEVKTAGMYDELGGFIGIVGVARDLTERRRAEQQMRYLAQHDSLTGLPNRALFHDRLQQALNYCSRHQRQLAILLLDLNKFKPVNDTYGHAAGDELLKAVAGALRQSLRASDTVARLGGDEFVVLLPQLEQPNEAAKVAEKITAALALPFKLSMAEVQIGCSIGSALFPDDGSDADALIIVADGRMYQQKQLRHEGR